MAKAKFISSSVIVSDNDCIIERIRLLEQSAIEIADGASQELDDKFYFKSDGYVFDLES